MSPRTRTRYQVLVEDETRAHVQALAEQKGLAESAMCRLLIKEALELPHNQLNSGSNDTQKAQLDDAVRVKIDKIMRIAVENGLL